MTAILVLIATAGCALDSRPPADNSGVRFVADQNAQARPDQNADVSPRAEQAPRRMAENQRRAVYVRACAAEASALQEADRSVPLTDAVSVHKQADLQLKLRSQYIARIAAEYKLSTDEVEAIALEGRQSGWPTQ